MTQAREKICSGSFTVAPVLFLGLGDELVENGLALLVNDCFVRHDIFHADAAVLSDLPMGYLFLFQKLDQEGARDVEHLGMNRTGFTGESKAWKVSYGKGNPGNRFSTEVRARAVRMVWENGADYKSRSQAITSI